MVLSKEDDIRVWNMVPLDLSQLWTRVLFGVCLRFCPPLKCTLSPRVDKHTHRHLPVNISFNAFVYIREVDGAFVFSRWMNVIWCLDRFKANVKIKAQVFVCFLHPGLHADVWLSASWSLCAVIMEAGSDFPVINKVKAKNCPCCFPQRLDSVSFLIKLYAWECIAI